MCKEAKERLTFLKVGGWGWLHTYTQACIGLHTYTHTYIHTSIHTHTQGGTSVSYPIGQPPSPPPTPTCTTGIDKQLSR